MNVRGLLIAAFLLHPVVSFACDPAGTPIVRVTETAGGTALLHYEATYAGYAPQFGTASLVSIAGTQTKTITIRQPVTDTADKTQLGAPPTTKFCDVADVDLGVLPAGAYTISWQFVVTPGGVLGGNGGFFWSGSEMQCSTTPQFVAYPSPPSSVVPTTLSLLRLETFGPVAPTQATVNANVITVTDFVDSEVPPPPSPTLLQPFCGTSSVTVGPLAAGAYTVKWRVQDFGVLSDIGTFALTVNNAPPPPSAPLFGPTGVLLLCATLALAGAVALRR